MKIRTKTNKSSIHYLIYSLSSMTIFEAVIKIVIDWSMTIWGLEKVGTVPFIKVSLTGQ